MSKAIPSPSLSLLATEPLRCALDWAHLWLAPPRMARGQGEPVIVYPGLGTNHVATTVFRQRLADAGFSVHDWGHGLNKGPRGDLDTWIDGLVPHIEELHACHGHKVALVGWSLGGVFAREVAKKVSHLVSQVITLGSPFALGAEGTNGKLLYQLLNGAAPDFPEHCLARLRKRPPVPTTSVFSRADGVVAWQGSVEPDSARSQSIEVSASHLGLVSHPHVLEIVADRLALGERRWTRYSRQPLSPVLEAA